jgi:hypothetical protein
MQRCSRVLVVALLVGTMGCGQTNYVPVRSPRVSLTSNGFVRDGAEYSSLTDAVEGNPRAEEEANQARSFTIGGIACSAIGDLAIGIGIGLDLAGSRPGPDNQPNRPAMANAGLGLAIGGLALAVVGVTLLTHGQAHQKDAINIYNDDAVGKTTPTTASP